MSNFLKSAALAATLSLVTAGAAFPDTPTAEAKAENEAKIQMAVSIGSKAWKDAFNAGDAAGAATMYEDDAVMVVKPFGTFKGKDEILAF